MGLGIPKRTNSIFVSVMHERFLQVCKSYSYRTEIMDFHRFL